MIDRLGVVDDPGGRDAAIGRLEADDAAEGGGPDHRADRLAAERQLAEARRDRRRRAAARPARRVAEVVRVARAVLLEPGELGRHRLAEDQRARRPQQPDDRRLRPREQLRRHRRPGARHVAVHMDDILHPDEDAVERRAARRVRVPPLQFLRLAQQSPPPVRLRQQRMDLRIGRFQPRAFLIDVLIERQRPGPQISGSRSKRSGREIHEWRSLPSSKLKAIARKRSMTDSLHTLPYYRASASCCANIDSLCLIVLSTSAPTCGQGDVVARRQGILQALMKTERDTARQRTAQMRAETQAMRTALQAQRAYVRAQYADQKERVRLYTESRIADVTVKNEQIEETISSLRNLLSDALMVRDHIDLQALWELPRLGGRCKAMLLTLRLSTSFVGKWRQIRRSRYTAGACCRTPRFSLTRQARPHFGSGKSVRRAVRFEGGEEALRHGIVPAISRSSIEAVLRAWCRQPPVGRAGVLDAAIGVLNYPGRCRRCQTPSRAHR